MGIIENFLKSRGYLKARHGQLPEWLQAVAHAQRWQMPDYSKFEEQAQTYSRSVWVYFCVTRIMEKMAPVPYQVYETHKEEETAIVSHDFEQRLRRPNKGWSGYELQEFTSGSLELMGNTLWYLNLPSDSKGNPRKGATPLEIWPLRADRVTIIPDPDVWVKGYIYTVDGVQCPLHRDEVVHFKRWNPLDDYYGLSTIQALGYAIEGSINAQAWNARFFHENAIPAGIVSIKEHISDADYAAVVKQWKGKYQGVDNAHKIAFIRGSDVSVSTLGLPHKDLQFMEYLELTQRQIFNAYGMPMGKWVENATEANANVAERTFINDTVCPKLERIASQITAKVLPLYGDNLVGHFKDISIPDKDIELRELELILRGTVDPTTGMPTPVMAVDEIRQKYWKLPPMAEVVKLPSAAGKTAAALAEGKALFPQELIDRATQADLRRWRDVAVRVFKAGDDPSRRQFSSAVIPARTRASVQAGLDAATTLEEVKAAFAAPFRVVGWEGYP